jgi:hypothetical protein
VPGVGGVDQVDGDLGVLDAAGGTGVLALDPNGGGALLYRSSPNRVTARLSAEPLWSKGTREEPLVTSLREVL